MNSKIKLNDKEFTIWLAGFYEGEGSTYIYKGHRGYLRCGLGQSNKNIMVKICSFLKRFNIDTTVRKHKVAYNGKLFYAIQPFEKEGIKFLALLRPFMHCNHKIAQIKRVHRIMKIEQKKVKTYIKELKDAKV